MYVNYMGDADLISHDDDLEWIILEQRTNTTAAQQVLDRIRINNPNCTLYECALIAIDENTMLSTLSTTSEPTSLQDNDDCLNNRTIEELRNILCEYCTEQERLGKQPDETYIERIIVAIHTHPDEVARRERYLISARAAATSFKTVIVDRKENVNNVETKHFNRHLAKHPVIECAITPSMADFVRWAPGRFRSDFTTSTLHPSEIVAIWGSVVDTANLPVVTANPIKSAWFDTLAQKVYNYSPNVVEKWSVDDLPRVYGIK